MATLVLAADPAPGDGVAVLGTTLVLKQFHNPAGRWYQQPPPGWTLVGGASNAGAGVQRFFSDQQLQELVARSTRANPADWSCAPCPNGVSA